MEEVNQRKEVNKTEENKLEKYKGGQTEQNGGAGEFHAVQPMIFFFFLGPIFFLCFFQWCVKMNQNNGVVFWGKKSWCDNPFT